MYLNIAKLVTSAQRPSSIKWMRQEMSLIEEVKGAATLASAWDKETPMWAAFNAYN